MEVSKALSTHIDQMHFGGNWTVSNLHGLLSNISWEEAQTKVENLSTIASLAFHINYFIVVVTRVFEGGPLEGKDAVSYDHPFKKAEDWHQFLEKMWKDAKAFSSQVERIGNEELAADFVDAKYGSMFRQILGIIEHSHYHLGQIAIIKKLIQAKRSN